MILAAEKSEHVEAEKDWMIVRKLRAIKKSAKEMCSIASNFGESVTVILCYSIQKLKCRTSTQKTFVWTRISKASNLKISKKLSQHYKKILQNLQRSVWPLEKMKCQPRILLLPLHHLQEVDMTIGPPCNLAEFTKVTRIFRTWFHIWVFSKNRGTPKWMVYDGKPY